MNPIDELFNKGLALSKPHITMEWNVVGANQYVAWRFLDGKICLFSTQPSPMPWVVFSKN